MPFPMIHFSIAYRIFEGYPGHAFLLGSISPDAVQLRDDKESKAYSHLHDRRGSYPEWSGLHEFYNARINTYEDEDYKEYLLGYLSHIIADHQWIVYKRQISHSNKSILQDIWTEEAQYDFNLYRTVPWREELKKQVLDSPLYAFRMKSRSGFGKIKPLRQNCRQKAALSFFRRNLDDTYLPFGGNG